MKLKTFGSFIAGGEITARKGHNAGELLLRNHAYVEYFLPEERHLDNPPIILAHNYFGAAAWLGNADGKEGWAQYLIRRGFPVFIVDPPGTGRAGFNPDDIDKEAMVIEGAFPVDEGFWPGQDSSAWAAWNMGPEWGTAGDGVRQGNRMPTHEDAQRRLLATLTPNLPMAQDVLDTTFVDVLEAVNRMEGPPVFVGWSMGGGMGQRLALRCPDLLRGLVLLDGYSGERRFPEPGHWFDNGPLSAMHDVATILADAGIPLLNLNSAAGHHSNTGHAGKLGKMLTDRVVEIGGVAKTVWLPDVGIHGNGHLMFFENNSDEIAGIVADWIVDTVNT
ncbi:alpha/beta fold hydrolase [Pseudomonas alliivorans]|nr:alpha/beta fold hydrolase [Pseudomonas alliivorans]